MNRRRFVGYVMAVAASGYASGEKEFVGFDRDECHGCSRISWDHGKSDHYYANLSSGRQVEITEKDFNALLRMRHA